MCLLVEGLRAVSSGLPDTVRVRGPVAGGQQRRAGGQSVRPRVHLLVQLAVDGQVPVASQRLLLRTWRRAEPELCDALQAGRRRTSATHSHQSQVRHLPARVAWRR